MTIVAHAHPFVVGVDTHARNHVLAILAATGEAIDIRQFPTTPVGMARAIAWAARRTGGDLDTLWVIEGVASYGAGLAAAVERTGYQVVEAARMDTRAQRSVGKSDPLDAARIAAAVLPLDTARLRRPRMAEGVRAALRVLIAARDHMTTERTATLNALIALLRVVDLGIDARKSLTRTQITTVARWHTRDEGLSAATARTKAVRLAKRVTDLEDAAVRVADHRHQLGVRDRGGGHRLGLRDRVGQRLLAQHVLVGLQRRDRDLRVRFALCARRRRRARRAHASWSRHPASQAAPPPPNATIPVRSGRSKKRWALPTPASAPRL